MEKELTIVGVSDEIMALSYVCLTNLQEIVNMPDMVNKLYTQFEPELESGQRAEIIKEIYENDNVVLVQDIYGIVEDIGGVLESNFAFLGIVAIFALIVVFFILYNATLMSIGDHESEYGIFRALGYSKWDIYRKILSENLLSLVVSIALATILTPFAGQWMISIYEGHLPMGLAIPIWVYYALWIVPIFISNRGDKPYK